jgi:hypothetical protein
VFSLETKKCSKAGVTRSLEEVEIESKIRKQSSIFENCELEPLYLSKDCENAINILYYENHCMFIKNINSFFKTSITNSCNLCFRCLYSFSTKIALVNHELKCEEHEYCKIIIPETPKLE